MVSTVPGDRECLTVFDSLLTCPGVSFGRGILASDCLLGQCLSDAVRNAANLKSYLA